MPALNRKPSSGSEWRRARQQTDVVDLPSGNTVELRKVKLMDLVVQGKIPQLLQPVIDELFEKRDVTSSMTDSLIKSTRIYDVVCRAAFVSPRVVDQPVADDEVSLDDIDFEDKAFVFQHLQGVGQPLEKFPAQQGGGVELTHGGEDVQYEA